MDELKKIRMIDWGDITDKELDLIKSLDETLAKLKALKPNDRKDKDRHYAIAITEMEKVIGFVRVYCIATISD